MSTLMNLRHINRLGELLENNDTENLAANLKDYQFAIVSFSFLNLLIPSIFHSISMDYIKREQKVNQDLEVSNKNLMETMKSKDVFLTGVSHELRNPLNSLKGNIDIIQDTLQTQE